MANKKFGENFTGPKNICHVEDRVNFKKFDLLFHYIALPSSIYLQDDAVGAFETWKNNTLPGLSYTYEGDGVSYNDWFVPSYRVLASILTLQISARWGAPGIDTSEGYPFDLVRQGYHNFSLFQNANKTVWDSNRYGTDDKFNLYDVSNDSLAVNKDSDFLGKWIITDVHSGGGNFPDPLGFGSSNLSFIVDDFHPQWDKKETLSWGKAEMDRLVYNPKGYYGLRYVDEGNSNGARMEEPNMHTANNNVPNSPDIIWSSHPAYNASLYNMLNNVDESYTSWWSGMAINTGNNEKYLSHEADGGVMVPLIKKINETNIYDDRILNYNTEGLTAYNLEQDNHHTTPYISAMLAGDLGFGSSNSIGMNVWDSTWRINNGNFKQTPSTSTTTTCQAKERTNISLAASYRQMLHIYDSGNAINNSYQHGINIIINKNSHNFQDKFSTPAGPFKMSDFRGVGHRGIGVEIDSHIDNNSLPIKRTIGIRHVFPGPDNVRHITYTQDNPYHIDEVHRGIRSFGLMVSTTGQIHLGGDKSDNSGNLVREIDTTEFNTGLDTNKFELIGEFGFNTNRVVVNSYGNIVYSNTPPQVNSWPVERTYTILSYQDANTGNPASQNSFIEKHLNLKS